MKNPIKNLFYFTKTERNGTIILLIILLAVVLFYTFEDSFIVKDKSYSAAEFVSEINLFEKNHYHQSNNYYYNDTIKQNDTALSLFYFDPNNLSADKWRLLGLNDKQIKVINNYEAKGGTFKSKEDVKKMYCIGEKKYAELEPYIKIASRSSDNKNSNFAGDKKYVTKDDNIVVEINSADSLQLMKIRGIGIGFARRIIKYRNMLGGFYKKEQLMEVYGLDSAKYFSIENNVRADKRLIKKKNLNTITADELRKHPYFGYRLANAVVNFRTQNGIYKSVDDLKKVKAIKESDFIKISYYLYIEQ